MFKVEKHLFRKGEDIQIILLLAKVVGKFLVAGSFSHINSFIRAAER